MVSKWETARLHEVFNLLDANGDGKLQYEEVLAGYNEFFGDTAEEEVKRIY